MTISGRPIWLFSRLADPITSLPPGATGGREQQHRREEQYEDETDRCPDAGRCAGGAG